MLPYRDTRLTKIALAVFFIAVVGYGYFEARGILWGPSIEVPASAAEVHEQLITIEGKASHIATLSMNGNEIPVTEEGAFSHQYLLAPGYNRIVLDAKDKYGTHTQRVVEVIYTPQEPAKHNAPATTTPAGASAQSDAQASTTLDAPLSR